LVQVIGGLATPLLDVCHEEVDDSCSSFKREDCNYDVGNVVFNRSSVANSHACQSLLSSIGYIYGGVYFVYDGLDHTCRFYDALPGDCDGYSGPDLPDIQDCNL
jgi:hypothetical protein